MVAITTNFIYLLFIMLLTSLLFIRLNPNMPSDLRCPACKSDNIIEYEDYIECRDCKLDFFKEFLGKEIAEENLLSLKELEGITGAFEELEDEEARKKFVKKLKKDSSRFQDI